MADIEYTYAHNTDFQTAKEKAQNLINDFIQSNAKLVKESNTADNGRSGSFKGKGFSGKWFVDEEKLGVSVDLSFMLKALKGTVREKLEARIKEAFPDGHRM